MGHSKPRGELGCRARRTHLATATKPFTVHTHGSCCERSTAGTPRHTSMGAGARAYGPSFILRSGILSRAIPGTRPTYGLGTSGSGPAAFAVPWSSCTFSLHGAAVAANHQANCRVNEASASNTQLTDFRTPQRHLLHQLLCAHPARVLFCARHCACCQARCQQCHRGHPC